GSHGTTFGGGALASAAALAVLEVIEKEDLLAKVTRQSPPWHARLRGLAGLRPDLVAEVRGAGYMVGVALRCDPVPVCVALREAGLLAAPAGGVAVRLLPPLTASAEELEEAAEVMSRVLRDWKAA
ncbi:MAG: aminotransferase class III-fold pyridoxal phosphate-dependent enzyme, partial [Opitutales bacterium]